MQKIFRGNFSLAFLSHQYGFINCFEMLNFIFFNMISRGVSTCKILTFQDECFQKCKAQNIVKLIFSVFLASKHFALKSIGTLKMFLLSAQNNFCIIISSFVEGYVQEIQVWILCIRLVSRPLKSRCFWKNLLWS